MAVARSICLPLIDGLRMSVAFVKKEKKQVLTVWNSNRLRYCYIAIDLFLYGKNTRKHMFQDKNDQFETPSLWNDLTICN